MTAAWIPPSAGESIEMDEDDDDGDDCCIHGVGFDEDCERCEDDEDEASLEYQAHYCA